MKVVSFLVLLGLSSVVLADDALIEFDKLMAPHAKALCGDFTAYCEMTTACTDAEQKNLCVLVRYLQQVKPLYLCDDNIECIERTNTATVKLGQLRLIDTPQMNKAFDACVPASMLTKHPNMTDIAKGYWDVYETLLSNLNEFYGGVSTTFYQVEPSKMVKCVETKYESYF